LRKKKKRKRKKRRRKKKRKRKRKRRRKRKSKEILLKRDKTKQLLHSSPSSLCLSLTKIFFYSDAKTSKIIIRTSETIQNKTKQKLKALGNHFLRKLEIIKFIANIHQ